MERASLKERCLALIIDCIIFALIFLAAIFVVAGTIFITDVDKAKIIVLVLNILFLLKDSTRQSPGKRLLGIKIVRKSDFNKPNIMLLTCPSKTGPEDELEYGLRMSMGR